MMEGDDEDKIDVKGKEDGNLGRILGYGEMEGAGWFVYVDGCDCCDVAGQVDPRSRLDFG